jgi:Protein of unknown function (DUF3237)
MIALVSEMTFWAQSGEAIEPTHGSPFGAIQFLGVAAATLTGKRIDAKLIGAGYDWMRIGDDGYWRPEVQAQFRTADGAIVLMRYSGLVEHNEALLALAAADRLSDCSAHYMRMVFSFVTGADRYRWLNTSVFVGAATRVGAGQVEYEIYRVT